MKKYPPKQGYDKLAKKYKNFHKALEKWHGLDFVDLLDLSWYEKELKVLDVWSWNCRLYPILMKVLGKIDYVACDISSSMLKQCSVLAKKVECDLNDQLPFENETFDLVMAFFVLLHVQNLDMLVREVHRILKPGGRFLVFHHIEKKPLEHKVGGEKFIIENMGWRYQHVKSFLINAGFDVQSKRVEENGTKVGEYILAIKY